MSPSFERDLLEIAEPSATAALVDRGLRLPQFIGLKCDAGAALDALRVAVIGAGSVGRNVVLHLARLMIGALCIIDRGHFKNESLLTQPIEPADVGQAKASNAGRLAKRISPRTRVFSYDGAVEELPCSALADVDLVILATDNLSVEVHVGQLCVHLGKPLLHLSVHGESLVVQARIFGNATASGACPACVFGASEWSHLNQETTYSCAGQAAGKNIAQVSTVPTMSVSLLCALAADLGLLQALRFVLGLGEPQQDCILQYCGYTHQAVVAPLVRNPECPCDHTAWSVQHASRPLESCSLAELASAAGFDGAEPAFNVDDRKFVELGVCERCEMTIPVNRFAAPAQVGSCVCGGRLAAPEYFAHRPLPAALAGPLLDRPLAALGAADTRFVLVRGPERAVLFC